MAHTYLSNLVHYVAIAILALLACPSCSEQASEKSTREKSTPELQEAAIPSPRQLAYSIDTEIIPRENPASQAIWRILLEKIQASEYHSAAALLRQPHMVTDFSEEASTWIAELRDTLEGTHQDQQLSEDDARDKYRNMTITDLAYYVDEHLVAGQPLVVEEFVRLMVDEISQGNYSAASANASLAAKNGASGYCLTALRVLSE